jgi:hypothetical protein
MLVLNNIAWNAGKMLLLSQRCPPDAKRGGLSMHSEYRSTGWKVGFDKAEVLYATKNSSL